MKKLKTSIKQSHTASSQKGMGDNYGTGLKNKVGKVIEGLGVKPVSNKKLGVPPKKLA